jgi:hypothetical protein
MLYVVGVDLSGEIRPKDVHIEHWVQAKERRNIEHKINIPHNLGDGVWPITEWAKLLMWSYKTFFLQVQPNFVAHLKLMWNLMLIMALLVLVIGLL